MATARKARSSSSRSKGTHKYGPKAQHSVEREMHEFKQGKL
jgi:hypothetical protein